ncbi:MAG: DUF2807 domain-containing protein [Mucinivorans sp.]
MKKLFITLLMVCSLTASNVSAQQKSTVTRFEGKSINGLIVDGAFDVKLSQGAESSMKIEIRDDLKEKLNLDLTEQGYLRLDYGSELGKYFTGKNRPVATIVVSRLDYLKMAGVTSVIAHGDIHSQGNFSLILSGSAFLDALHIICQGAFISVDGGAKIESNTKIEASDSVRIETSGASKSSMVVWTKVLRVSTALTSLLELSGSCDSMVATSGAASRIEMLAIQCPDINATTSGMSSIKANITGKATVFTNGASSFRYIGPGVVSGDGAKKL